MAVYSYRALNEAGRTIRGVVDADTPRSARRKLRSEGLHPVEMHPVTDRRAGSLLAALKRRWPSHSGRLGRVTDLTRQLATLVSAGLPLVQALGAIQEQVEDRHFGRIIAMVRESVTQGESLAAAMSGHPETFGTDYIQLIQAGELGGALDLVLERLADSLEKRAARRARVMAALTYPVFMAVVGTVVVFFLLAFIVPTLTDLFDTLGAALPWPTRLLLAVSGFLQHYWWAVLLLLAVLILLFSRWLKKDRNYQLLEKRAFRIPILGSLWQKLLLALTFRSLAVMVGGGVTLSRALQVTARALGRSVYSVGVRTAADMVAQGRGLAEGLAASGLFPPVSRRMIAVGEAGGALDNMLDRLARSYEEETDRNLSTLTSLVEPIIILLVGLLVGFIVMAVLLPRLRPERPGKITPVLEWLFFPNSHPCAGGPIGPDPEVWT